MIKIFANSFSAIWLLIVFCGTERNKNDNLDPGLESFSFPFRKVLIAVDYGFAKEPYL